jgi:signal transduction histidine kinase
VSLATVSSFQLAKEHVTKERDGKISRAVGEMSFYMAGILNSETARDYTDYVALHTKRPVAVWSDNAVDLDAKWVVLRSPIAMARPPHDWIDLYFQFNPDDGLSSPQIIEDTAPWPVDSWRTFPAAEHRARQTLAWLKTVLPGIDLHIRVAQICRCDNPLCPGADSGEPGSVSEAGRECCAAGDTVRPPMSREYQQRQASLRDSQCRYLPPDICVEAGVAERNVRNVARGTVDGFDDGVMRVSGDVEISLDPIVPFWLGPGPDGGLKLAFARECRADVAVFYQGFIGDWDRLKPKLLDQIANLNLFPELDLEPVPNDAEPDPEASKMEMINLPVRLKVPEIPGGAAVAAWRSIRMTLITTWAAAAAVLIVAGWGLRNLVALTERRMQFAYAVTHELRTPLTTFRLYSDMLAAGLVPDTARQEYLDTLNRESLRLSSLVEEVLEYARLGNRRVRLNPTETDGASLLRAISETLADRCGENSVEMRTENATPNGERLVTDVDLVNRISGVLVNNACRHARGRANATVLVRLAGDQDRVYLDVIDSGPGIDRSDTRTIFKPFRRGKGTDAEAMGGIGLGLALARTWAKLLGGRLELAARQHPEFGGAHFRLTIPARPR